MKEILETMRLILHWEIRKYWKIISGKRILKMILIDIARNKMKWIRHLLNLRGLSKWKSRKSKSVIKKNQWNLRDQICLNGIRKLMKSMDLFWMRKKNSLEKKFWHFLIKLRKLNKNKNLLIKVMVLEVDWLIFWRKMNSK
jgi:hypothetical protein